MVVLLWMVFFALGPPSGSVKAALMLTSTCDEHPWDKIKSAYRVQFLIITDEYVLVAVWYTREQFYPVILRIDSAEQKRARPKSTFILAD